MTSVPLQVQFDPASARFGAARSQKRLEDDRLLAGKGLFSDDREFPNQAWLVVVRSPHAHAKILKVDLADARKAKGVIAAWSMADLRVDGVGHIPFPPAFKRADGSPMAAPARPPLNTKSSRGSSMRTPPSPRARRSCGKGRLATSRRKPPTAIRSSWMESSRRSEEHTSELQSLPYLV